MFSDVLHLILGFGKAGFFGYGGGAAIVEMLRTIAVYHNGWLTEQEYADAVTISYSLPGPVATQLAGVIGWKVAGFIGSVTAIIAVLLPSLGAMFLICYLLKATGQNPVVQGIMKGIRPVVFAILAIITLDFLKDTKESWLTASIGAFAFVLFYYFKINPAFVIIGGMIIGGFFLRG